MSHSPTHPKNYRARQWLVDLTGCDPSLLGKPARLRELVLEGVRRGGATAVTDQFHQAEILTGTVIMPSGRLAIQAWPTTGAVTLDIVDAVSDNEESGSLDFGAVVEFLRDMLRATDLQKSDVFRGETRPHVAPAEFMTEGAWLQ